MGEVGKVEYPGADVMPRDPTDGAVLVVEIASGLGASTLHRSDVNRLLFAVFGALG